MAALRLIFMGTPDIAVPSLAALIEAGHQIACVYSQPPRPAGRGQKERPSPVQAYAEGKGILVRYPTSLNTAEVQQEFAALGADAAIVIAYGLILPQAVLDAPRLGCLNIHMSLLPRWRGAAPLQRAIMAGDSKTGVTIMQMDAGLDTGAVLSGETVPITLETTAESLHDSLAEIGARLVTKTLDELDAGHLVAQSQSDDGATYAKKLSREDGRLDWHDDAVQIHRQIRALNPWPGTWFERDGERIRVLAAMPVDSAAANPPGTVLDEGATIACGKGAIQLIRLQRPGKSALDADAFLRGYTLPAGTVLGAS